MSLHIEKDARNQRNSNWKNNCILLLAHEIDSFKSWMTVCIHQVLENKNSPTLWIGFRMDANALERNFPLHF
jgi:hypothetical protein